VPVLTPILRKARALLRLTSASRMLMVEAFVALAVARISLVVFPFRKVAAQLGAIVPLQDGVARHAVKPAESRDRALARKVGWAVTRMARHAPFRAVCLQQAIAAKMMLRRRGVASAMHLGVASPEALGAPLQAHAWLDVGCTPVTGYPIAEGFVEIARFV
jgi:hypothetical protein